MMNITGTGSYAGATQPATKSNYGQNVPDTNGTGSKVSSDAGLTATAKPADDPVKDFLEYMQMTPAERMERAWLKQHGISKEEFDAMSPAEKQKLMDEMKKDIAEKIKLNAEEESRKHLDILT